MRCHNAAFLQDQNFLFRRLSVWFTTTMGQHQSLFVTTNIEYHRPQTTPTCILPHSLWALESFIRASRFPPPSSPCIDCLISRCGQMCLWMNSPGIFQLVSSLGTLTKLTVMGTYLHGGAKDRENLGKTIPALDLAFIVPKASSLLPQV